MIDKEEANRLRRMVNVWNCFHEECVLCVHLLSPWSIHCPYFSNLLHALRGYGFISASFLTLWLFAGSSQWEQGEFVIFVLPGLFLPGHELPVAEFLSWGTSLMATSLSGFLLPFTLKGNSSFPSDADSRALSHPCFPVTLLTPGQIVFSLNSPRIGVRHLFPLWDPNWCRMQEEAEWRQVKYCLRHIV